MKRSQRDGTPIAPVLITEAAPSYAEQHAARRKKYAIMMAMRLPIFSASSRSATSITKMPPNRSLVSMNGPSWISGLPFRAVSSRGSRTSS